MIEEEKEYNTPERLVILVLSGFIRELKEGKDFETTIDETAETIAKIFAKPVIVKRKWFEKSPVHWKYLLCIEIGIIIGLTLPY